MAVTQLGENLTLYLNGTVAGQTNNPMPPFRIGNTTNNWLGRSQFYIRPYDRPYFRLKNLKLKKDLILKILED